MILPYLIKSMLCLGILFGFYKIALESKAMHQFKRFYLLASLLFAFTLPLITFSYTTTSPAVSSWAEELGSTWTEVAPENVTVSTPEVDYTGTLLWSVYTLGFLVFGIRFVLNLFRLKRKIDTSQLVSRKDFTLALLRQKIVPHSFFKWIFINKAEYANKEIAPEVLAHEATHVRQKHSWDILFIEILQVVFWFNPLIWLSKKSIKLNHEFLADQGAIKNKSNIAIYQNILLSYASSTHHTALESPFNYSLTKKRILMLSQSFSKKKLLVQAVLLIPILALCALLFNQAIIAQPSSENLSNNIANQDQKEKIYARNIDIFIADENTYKVNDIAVSKTALTSTLESLHKDLSKKERDQVINLHITARGKILHTDLAFIQKIASAYGYHRIITPHEEIIRSKGNTPMHPKNTDGDSYAQEFIKGAQRNGKRSIVIEVKNDSIYVNGTYTPLNKLRKNINTVTANWTKEDYTDPMRSMIFKGNSAEFIKRAEKEFQKTKLYKANNKLRLIPPAPPAPSSPSFPLPPPAPPSPAKHIVKMKKLGGNFYLEGKEISYDQALTLVKTNTNTLSIKTPYPYSNPPVTYLSTKTFPEKSIKGPTTAQQIEEYNRLAKKYNANPKGLIIAKEVTKMFTIYSKMTTEQKTKAAAYPSLPPPPAPSSKGNQ